MDSEIPEKIIIQTFRQYLEGFFTGLSMQRERGIVEDYHMPDHVHMQVQNFWFRRDVVFVVVETEQSLSTALEYGTSSSI